MSRFLPMSLSVLAALSVAPRRAHADGPATDDVVVTGTRTPERTQRATVKTDVVTREEAERRGATNVAEALTSQPGVQVNPGAYGSLGNVSPIQIQGFDLQRVLVLEDGEPVIGDVGGAIDLAAIPVADLERIEIVTGPTSALYGSSAVGGVVNLVTGPPRDDGPSARARVEGRSRRGLVTTATAAYRGETRWVAADASFTRGGGVRAREELPDLQVPDSRRALASLRAGTQLGERVDLRVRVRFLRDALEDVVSREVPGLSRSVVDRPTETDRVTLHVIETLKLGRSSSLRLTLGRQWADSVSESRQRGSAVGDLRERTHRMQSFEAIATVADGPRTWVAGTRAQAESFDQTLTKTESLATGLTETRAQEVVPQSLGSAAAYSQLQWRLGALTLLPGARFEVNPRFGNALTPRLAARVAATEHVQIRASAGRGFRAPSAKELGFTFDHSTFGYRVLGADDLRAETSWGANADVQIEPTKSIRCRAGGFANWVEDLIDIDLAGAAGGSAVVDYRYRNFGRARTFGAFVDGAFQPSKRLRLEASYDYLWTRNDLEDRPLGGRPPHTVTASVRVLPLTKLEAYARVRFTSDSFVDVETRSPGATTVDLRVGRELWPSSQLYAGVLNALDVKQEPGRVGDLRSPLGRTVLVGLRADFPWENP